MENFVVAAQLYTVRDLLNGKSKEEITGTLSAIKEMGYDAVQISGVGKVTKELAVTYKEVCKMLELEICATHAGLNDYEDDLEWIIEYHRMWGCQYAGIGSMPVELRHSEGVYEFAKRANIVGEKLKEAGIHLVYHNHRFEFEKNGDKNWMEILFESFNPSFVEYELDTHWVQAGGGNPEAWIRKVDGRMGVVHFKDLQIVKDEQHFAEIGKGNLDWKGIVKACRETGVKYAAVEQDSYTDDPLESLRISRKYLKTVM